MTRKSHVRNILILVILALVIGGWWAFRPDKARLDLAEVQGATPKLEQPRAQNVPTIRIADVVGWKAGATPVAAKGLKVSAFADKLDHPRWLHELPNGDILVAESTQPVREGGGVEQWIVKNVIGRANGSTVPANRITLLRDGDGDGVAETRSTLLSAANGLNSPLGMALIGEKLYIANTDAILVFPYKKGDTKIEGKGEKLIDLAANAPNNHWTRNVLAAPDGQTLYVTIGSNSNIAEKGMDAEKDRAQIKSIDLKTGQAQVYAYGLRNPTGLAFNPISGTLWTTVNERDMLGSDGPPDYMTTVDFGTFYGWPFYYWGQNEDRRVPQVRQDLKQYTKRPDYALGPHVAALGIAFSNTEALGKGFARGAFVGLHGSWNRAPISGYKVIYVPFNERGFPLEGAKPVDVLSGFLDGNGDAQGRPAGVLIDRKGNLLVADDSGNRVWRVTAG